ncbi:MAG TPA: uridine kinase [candidate division Zixibacteria bacterium]|nr:uridine kinase [candidate division Zixibacteria bacterium]
MKPYFIGIAGPSCAGKSFLSQHVARELGAATFHLDSYYRELNHMSLTQRAHFNFDSPEALESDLLLRHIAELAQGKPIRKPIYDFTTHTRMPETEPLEPQQYIIIEGLFALFWEGLRKVEGTKVYVDLGEELCLERRIERDISERGRTRESVLEQYRTTVQPMAKQYVYPTRNHADIVVTGDDDILHEASVVLAHVRAGAASLLK